MHFSSLLSGLSSHISPVFNIFFILVPNYKYFSYFLQNKYQANDNSDEDDDDDDDAIDKRNNNELTLFSHQHLYRMITKLK